MSTPNVNRDSLTLKRKWNKYYSAEEVDNLVESALQSAESARAELARISASQQALIQANEKQSAMIASFRAKTAEQEALVADQLRQITALGDQLTFYRNENLAQSEKIAQQNVYLSRMQARLTHQGEQISSLESQTTDELRQDAIRKADEIVARAIADSERILLQATEQRGRLIAACRAAYYSALQFKQDLAEQFKNMERELDASIDVLQFMDNSRLSLNHQGDIGEPSSNPDTVIS